MIPTNQPDQTPEMTQHPALKSLLSGKLEIAETRLAVTATQIVERLRIRASHLAELMDEELGVDSQLLRVQRAGIGGSLGTMGIESQLDQRMSQIRSAQRRENTECWRDLTQVMRDFLNAWEGFSRNEAKSRFLEALPGKNAEPGAIAMPVVPTIYHHDANNNPYNQR